MRIENRATLKLLCEHADALAKQLASSSSNVDKAKWDISSSYTDDDVTESVNQLLEASNNAYQSIRAFFENTQHLRWQGKDTSHPLFRDSDTSIRRECQRLGICAAFLHDGAFLLKTVHPISRYSKRASKSPHDMEVASAISEAIKEAMNQGAYSPSTLTGPVTFFFWHVYRSPSNTPYVPPDNDNYLTKSIIDIICNAVGLSDMGTAAYIFHGSVQTDGVPEATYVFVVPRSSAMSDYFSFEGAKMHIPTEMLKRE